MKRVTFRVTYPAELLHPVHRALAAADASRMELLMWGPTASVSSLSWFDAEPETVSELFDAVPSKTSAEFVAEADGTYAFVHQSAYEFDDALMGALGVAPVVFLPPVVFEADGTATFEAVGETGGVSALYDTLNEQLTVSIERARPFRRARGGADLTARQREALRVAEQVGYYDVPRTGSVEAVSAELGCAPSTAGELLRKAERAVVREHV